MRCLFTLLQDVMSYGSLVPAKTVTQTTLGSRHLLQTPWTFLKNNGEQEK